jgi:hypothetical protein
MPVVIKAFGLRPSVTSCLGFVISVSLQETKFSYVATV